MMTIEINGHEFSVETAAKPDMDGKTKYVLRKIKGRGLTYETMRNAKNPSLLFCVNPNNYKLPGIWLHENDGALRQVEVA